MEGWMGTAAARMTIATIVCSLVFGPRPILTQLAEMMMVATTNGSESNSESCMCVCQANSCLLLLTNNYYYYKVIYLFVFRFFLLMLVFVKLVVTFGQLRLFVCHVVSWQATILTKILPLWTFCRVLLTSANVVLFSFVTTGCFFCVPLCDRCLLCPHFGSAGVCVVKITPP